MATDRRTAMLHEAMARYRAGRLSRRRMLGVLGALGVSGAAAATLLRGVNAKSVTGGGHAGHMAPAAALAQEATPAATPQLGERADGTRVWKVVAGGGEMEAGIEYLAFFPNTITVNAGDAIWWEIIGFHNVHFLSGAPLPSLVIPDTSGGTPAAGPPTLLLNPEIMLPSGGPDYDGTGVVNSGAPDPSAPPFVLTFTAPGSYDYYCTIHGEVMKGTVVVQEAGAAYPLDQAGVDAQAAEEMADVAAQGQALAETLAAAAATPAAGAVHEAVAGASEGQIEYNAFVPRELRIRAGETVRWTNRATDPPVPHTVTFVGGGSPPEFILVEPSEAGPPKFVLNPELTAPAGGPTYDGQGYANSGLLIAAPDAPLSWELTFDTPGTYRYYCAIHGDPAGGMVGDVVVE